MGGTRDDRVWRRQNGNVLPGSVLTKGRLLVATPPLEDPNFDRTVVYILEHHDDGALGVVINRPTDEPLADPLDRWDGLQAAPGSIFLGGPVEPDASPGACLGGRAFPDRPRERCAFAGRGGR